MLELIGIEVLFERWLRADIQIHHESLDEGEKRRKFELFREAFFWAWATDVAGFQEWLGQKAGCRWACSDVCLIPGRGLVPRGTSG